MSAVRRYLILTTVVMGSSLYATALLTTSTILPQMQGAMSATQDEIAWAMTFNILATAVVTPMTGWLVARFGAKNVMVWGILGFSLATMACGLSQSLEMLVLWRIVQGGIGAPVVPLSQTILLDSFPRHQHAMVLSIFGMAVGVAPVIGPVLGGYLAESYSWRWSFHMLVPLGLVAFVGLRLALLPDKRGQRIQLDWTGFLALATAMAAVQLVLARGVRLDWFESTEIIVECIVAVLAFYIFLAHCLTSDAPFLNLRPAEGSQLLHRPRAGDDLRHAQLHAHGAAAAAAAAARRIPRHPGGSGDRLPRHRHDGRLPGLGLTSRIDPRMGMSVGFLIQVASGLWMLTFDLNVTMDILVWNSLIQGFAVGIIWVPLSVVAFDTLEPSHRAEAASVFHLLRNIGSSFFISLSIAEIVRTTGANYSRMTEMISPYSTALSLPWATGRMGRRRDARASPRCAKEIAGQSAMIGYLNAFAMYTVASALAVALGAGRPAPVASVG
jgi:DHA2 family multidrug resistance protein